MVHCENQREDDPREASGSSRPVSLSRPGSGFMGAEVLLAQKTPLQEHVMDVRHGNDKLVNCWMIKFCVSGGSEPISALGKVLDLLVVLYDNQEAMSEKRLVKYK